MAEVKTWTVEQIEAAAERQDQLVSLDISWGVRLDRAVENAAMLRAFAAQTRQVEQMREWLEKKAAVSMSTGNDTVNLLLAASETAMYGALQEFSRLFLKDASK